MTNEDIRAELSRIYEQRGGLRASDVVEEARSDQSPLHAYFEWDDAKAGHEHRLHQARRLIRTVEFIVYKDKPERVFSIPSTNASGVRVSGEGRYEIASVLVSRPDELEIARGAATERLSAAKRYVDELSRLDRKNRDEYAGVAKKIDKSRADLESIGKKTIKPAKRAASTKRRAELRG